MIKAGVLFPRSTIFPLLGSDLIAGLRSYLQQHSLKAEVELILEPIGFGGDSKEIYQKTEKLLLIENVDILLAYIDLRVTDLIYPLVNATGKPMIIINPGANYPDNWVAPDRVIFLDLQDALLSRLTGKLAWEKGKRETIFTASYYDGGYHHGHSMVTPYLENGGSVVYNYISALKTAEFTIAPLKEFLESNTVRCLLSIFSGDESNRFLEELEGLGMPELEIFASPQMLEEQTLSNLKGSVSFTIYNHLNWHKDISSPENEQFKATVSEELKKPANIFSLLGWEAGQLLSIYLEKGQKMVDALFSEGMRSPRGNLKLDLTTHHLIGPAYKTSCGKGEGLKIEGVVSTSDCLDEWKKLIAASEGVEASGWTNTYLCY